MAQQHLGFGFEGAERKWNWRRERESEIGGGNLNWNSDL